MSLHKGPISLGRKSSEKSPFRVYIRECRSEFSRVTWTSKADVVAFVRVIFAVIFLLGIGIYCVDLFIKGLLNGAEAVVRGIFG